jgi:hypothetical protein
MIARNLLRSVVAVAAVVAVGAVVRRWFVPLLTATTGTWIGGVDGQR